MSTNLFVGTSAGNVAPRAIWVGTAAGNISAVGMWLGTASGNVLVWGALSASVPVTAGTSMNVGASGTVYINVAVTISGGIGPYTVAWTRVSDTGDNMTVSEPSGPTSATFSAVVPASSTASAVFFATVTDSSGRSTTTSQITVSLTNRYSSGGGL